VAASLHFNALVAIAAPEVRVEATPTRDACFVKAAANGSPSLGKEGRGEGGRNSTITHFAFVGARNRLKPNLSIHQNHRLNQNRPQFNQL
jgi:hypothetical protein